MKLKPRLWTILLVLCLPAAAAEKAAYDSNGRIIALLSEAEDIEAVSNLAAVLPTGKRIPLQTRREGRGLLRKGDALLWAGTFTLPDGGRGRMELKSEEDDSGLLYSTSVTAETPLDVEAIEFVIDLQRLVFLNGRVSPDGGEALALAPSRPASPVLYRGETKGLSFRDAGGAIALDIGFDLAREAAVVDRWDAAGRSFQVRAALRRGPFPSGESASLAAAIRLKNGTAAPAARLVLDTAKPRYKFDGFGANYCWNNASPISAYTLDNLKLAWGRTEMKVQQWDRERDNPGPAIRADMETMRRFQQTGVPYVISIWWLPERFYTDPFEKPRSAHFRKIDPCDGRDALRVYSELSGHVDLLVTDVVMPHMNGQELARQLTVLQPDLKVVYISGYAEPVLARYGVSGRGAMFLQKPFTPRELRRRVREALGALR